MSRTNIEDIYPLSPLQQGLLFHTLYASEAGVYFVQNGWTLRGKLDVSVFLKAWQDVIDRHTILRTAFVWERFEQPMQVVWKRVKLPVTELDLRGQAPEEQVDRVGRFLEEDRKKGFDLTRAPLMRVAVFRLADDAVRFVWSAHHLLLDGWSTQILLKEVFAVYDASIKGEAPRLDRARPYGEYIGWLQKQDRSKIEAFWRAELAGFSAPTRFGIDRAAGEARVAAAEFDERKLALPEALSAELATFARQHQLTLNTVLQGAWAILLARYGGEEDVLFGATVSGRSAPVTGIERIIGLFINTVAVRVNVDADALVLPWLRRLQDRQAELREYEHSALVDVQGSSDVPRGTQLFESLVVFENYPVEESLRRGPGAFAIVDARSVERPNYPLSLVGVHRRALHLTVGFERPRFDPAAIERMLGHLQILLEGVVRRPAAKLGELEILGEDERRRLLVEWNATRVEMPAETRLHELVEAAVDRAPTATAVTFEGASLSYRALDAAANRLAHRLQRLGVGPDVLVGVCMERSIEMVVALLGVLKAGGAYVPIDPSYPADRVRMMIEDARPPVILTQAALRGRLPEGAVIVALDEDTSLAGEPATRPACAATPEGLAYVIFTSGSTGRPKGAMIPHRAIVNHMRWMHGAWPLGDGSAVLQKTAASFDASVWEFWAPLMAGARLVMARPEGHRDTRYLAEAVAEHGITDLQLVPSMLELLLLEPSLDACKSLRRLYCGGEALSRSLVDRFRARLPGVSVVNLYGPTEVTIDAVAWVCEDAPRGAMEPIGRPIANVRAYVLDTSMRLVPEGVPGELHLGGAGVGRGYLGRADLTAERFVDSSFSAGADRLYKTGDRVRWLADGALEYLGRVDLQVKLRGYRVELGEIEAVLAQAPGVREAVVVARDFGGEGGSDVRLVAYVVPAAEAVLPADLRAFLKDRLPEHMVPGAYVALEKLPLMANGKVDRRALPAPDAGATTAAEHVAPRGAIEEALAGIFAEVLKVPEVGAHDGFFELGGHSVLATQAIARVRDALGADVPLRAIFEAPTVAELAVRVRDALAAEPGARPPPLVKAAREASIPLSFAQERMFFVDQLDPGNTAFNVPASLRLAGRMDAPALERALRELVRRHEVLRTTFSISGGRPAQIVHPGVDLALPIEDVSALPVDDRALALASLSAAEAQQRFDLARGPLLRARLVRLAEDDHVLLLTMHHIVSDAWTQGIINREITALYGAFSKDLPSPLPELPIQYADYAAWQRRWLAGDALASQLAYWKAQLEGAPRVLPLPTDRPRPPVQTYRGALRGMVLPAELARGLHELSRREGATLYMTLLAALDLLLRRYTGQDDIVVGTSIANRTHADTERLVGFFINALVLRTKVDPSETVRQLLARVKGVCLGAYAHQDTPFERLVQELAPEPDPSRSPLFQIIFTMVNTPREALALDGLELKSSGGRVTSVKYDLTFFVGEGPRGLGLSFAYNVDLFDAATVDRMLAHLRALLEAMVKEPQRKVSEIGVLPDDERRKLLVEWNDTAAAYPGDECAHELFEARADVAPDALALVAGAARLTFGELEARANRLAHHLRGLGVGPDATVGLCLDRSAEVVIAMLAIMKAGGAYVPLDPAFPPQRLAQILGEAGAKVLVADARSARSFVEGEIAIVKIDADAAAIAAESAARVDSGALPSSLAYVLFTSGSTGKPKGVAVEHRNLVSYVRGVASRLALPEASSYAHVSTFSADLGNTVLFPPLLLGGALHVIAEDVTTDPDKFARYFKQNEIDCLKIVPSHLSALLSAARPEQVMPRRLLVLGGEASSWELVERLERLAPACRIMNHYGPTETTVGVLTYAVEKGKRAPNTSIVPLGRPIPNNRIYLLDTAMQPVPVGVPGEVFVGGAQVARGYLGRPDLTDERFVADPFAASRGAAASGARLYRTGDRARYLPDGTLVFLGRADFQVKIRGYRVELGEVESALLAAPNVKEAVVLAQDDGAGGDKRLVAYVVPGSHALDVSDLRVALAQRLPDAMIPTSFVALDAIPLTPNGKIDRKALPALEQQRAVGAAAEDAPTSPTEEVLAAIWADIFGRDRIGVHERFADLGGHSLLAIQIVARAREAFQVDLPLRAIFESPTVAGLAERVDAAVRAGEGLEIPPIRRMPRGAELRLSFAQERLWFLDKLEPGSTFYNIASGMRFAGELDAGALERALRELMRRHEVLRTTFDEIDGEPVQVIHEEARLTLPVEDVSARSEEDREAALRKATAEEARHVFDLAKGPLFRARLVRLAEDDHALLLTVHHIVSDAWTRGVMSREIGALYEAFRKGMPSPLPELAVQYADYAYWQRSLLRGELLERQLGYWKKQLAGAPATVELATDKPRPAVPSHRGARHLMRLSPELSRALRDLAKREGVTLFMLLLAGWTALLHRYTGQDDIVIGTPVANRARPEIEHLCGFFVNTLVLRAPVGDDSTFQELCARVREVCLGAYAHQDMPFERLVQELAPERDLSRTPLFQVMFTLENTAPAGLSLGGTRRRGVAFEGTTAKFDLTLSMVDLRGGMVGLFEYSTDLFDAATIDAMARHLEVLLEGAVGAPETKIRELPMLPADERRRAFSEWNDPTASYPVKHAIHELFEAQAARTPDAVAVVFGDVRMTYRELDRKANQLAHHLRRHAVGAEVLVGLCMQRSALTIVAILGILKAGGAYVPLDPEYPKDRLAFMVEDSRVRVILSEAQFAATLPPHGAAVVLLDQDWEKIAEGPADPLPRAASPDSLAYVIYTSGSTGKPKGAMVTHANVARLFDATETWYRFDATDVWTMFHSYAFDFSVWEIWGALLHGGRLVVVPYWVSRSPDAFHELLRDEGVTVLNQTPSAFRQLVHAEQAMPRAAGGKPLALRWVIFGGEALDLNDLRPWWDRHGDQKPQLVNMYGITETTVHVTYRPVSRADLARPWSSVIGAPIPDLQLHVLDKHGELAPVGVVGEMFVGGAGVARGYLNRPELTAERFIADPFAPAGSARRLYRTGDLARRLPSGDLEYLGRVDHQVKIRGFRIELGEIEAVLGQHPAVRASVVVTREDMPGDKRLVAYVVPSGPAPEIPELRSFLKDKLPEFMVPSAFVVLGSLPLTENGKIDRRALPAPDRAAGTGRVYVAPRSAVEDSLVAIYGEVLGVPLEKVSVHDGFFDLGGSSLLAVKLFSAIDKVFDKKLPIATVFKAPTVAELGAVLTDEASAVPRSLIEMNPLTGERPPLFWCGFNFAELTRLSKQLSDLPIFHLQSGYFDVKNPATHIRDLAKRYVHDIRVVQPEGPYYLAGSCLDGYVAFEIALQLQEQGQRVALLVLVEREGPDAMYRRYMAARVTAYRVRYHEYRLMRLGAEERRRYVGELWQRFRKRTVASFVGRDAYEKTVLAYGKEDFVHLATAALRSYVPKSYHPGRVALIFSTATMTRLPTFLFPTCGWGDLIRGPTKLYVVPGDHETMVSEAHVKALADKLRVCIDDASRGGQKG